MKHRLNLRIFWGSLALSCSEMLTEDRLSSCSCDILEHFLSSWLIKNLFLVEIIEFSVSFNFWSSVQLFNDSDYRSHDILCLVVSCHVCNVLIKLFGESVK
jgi:hypothetical protein